MDRKKETEFDEFEFDDAIQPAFHQIVNPEKLEIDNSLPPLEIKDVRALKFGEHEIFFTTPKLPRRISIYLFVNKKKKDMFFQIAPGLFNFRCANIKATDEVEIFYTIGMRRCSSIFIKLNVNPLD